MSSQVSTNAENASAANQLSKESQQAATKGDQQMNEIVASMKEINQSAQNISKIIKIIDEIAFQTNLMALNAAVDAASNEQSPGDRSGHHRTAADRPGYPAENRQRRRECRGIRRTVRPGLADAGDAQEVQAQYSGDSTQLRQPDICCISHD